MPGIWRLQTGSGWIRADLIGMMRLSTITVVVPAAHVELMNASFLKLLSLPVLMWISLLAVVQPARAEDDISAVRTKLQKRFSDLTITDIRKAPVPGLYEVITGTQSALVSADGRYLIQGELIDLDTRRNLTAETRAGLILNAIKSVRESEMIVMGPENPKRVLTVFTDVDCPYCARLHQEVPKLNQAGVKVRYLLYPRAGKGTETYNRSVAVWCAKDRVEAIGIAKSGGKLDLKSCSNPVDRHLKLGAEIGVEGTPTIVMDDGRVIPGYVPASRLLATMGIANAETPAASK